MAAMACSLTCSLRERSDALASARDLADLSPTSCSLSFCRSCAVFLTCTRRLAGPSSMLRALAANCSENRVSWAVLSDGGTVKIITVRELPPSTGCSMCVSLLLRYGTCRLRSLLSSASITSPSAASDRLMCLASSSRDPSTPDLFTRSDPARSTRYSSPVCVTRLSAATLRFASSSPSSPASPVLVALPTVGSDVVEVTSSTMMRCDRELCKLRLVAAVDRFFRPAARVASTASTLSQFTQWRSPTIPVSLARPMCSRAPRRDDDPDVTEAASATLVATAPTAGTLLCSRSRTSSL
mmetsp:Transcript_12635/g.40371  ORF Transcript_12635/g.40371 Transcript_12635/m.40371 type:complete len:297 (-) Transcript_12635:1105-1995(-)